LHNGHGGNHRVDMLGRKFARSQKVNKGRAKQSRAVVNEIGVLLPSREVEVMAPTMVGKRQAVQVQFLHQQTSHPSQNKQTTAQHQKALCERQGHENPEHQGTKPHGAKFSKEVEMRVGIARNVFFDQRHSDV